MNKIEAKIMILVVQKKIKTNIMIIVKCLWLHIRLTEAISVNDNLYK